MRKTVVFALALLAGGLALAPAAHAGSVSATVPLQFDTWIPLDSTDGRVTIHRMRLDRKLKPGAKGKLFRPGSAAFTQELEIEIEFSNSDRDDWTALVHLKLLDADGKPIDGYDNDQNLDEGSHHDTVKITLPTLGYALDHAAKLEYEISFGPS